MTTENKNLPLNEETSAKALSWQRKGLLGIGAALAFIAVGMMLGGPKLTQAQTDALTLLDLKNQYAVEAVNRDQLASELYDSNKKLEDIHSQAETIKASLGF